MTTTNDIAIKGYQMIRSSALADVMTLSGVPCGAGDIYEALGRLGLRLTIARDSEEARLDGLTDEQHRLTDIFGSHLTDNRDCPKCGARLTRLKDKGDRWYHKRPDWGWRRACLGGDQ
jgi:hypothetical protein